MLKIQRQFVLKNGFIFEARIFIVPEHHFDRDERNFFVIPADCQFKCSFELCVKPAILLIIICRRVSRMSSHENLDTREGGVRQDVSFQLGVDLEQAVGASTIVHHASFDLGDHSRLFSTRLIDIVRNRKGRKSMIACAYVPNL